MHGQYLHKWGEGSEDAQFERLILKIASRNVSKVVSTPHLSVL